MITAGLRKYIMNLPVAAGWDDLRPDQFTTITSHLSQFTGAELNARITWSLLGITWRTPKKLAALFVALTPEERHRLTGLAKPFLKPDGLTATPLKELHAGKHTLVCAHHDLLNQIDAEEWGLVDTAFMRFNKTRDIMWLHAMAQGLYSLPGTSLEDRLHNNASEQLVKLVPREELLALHVMWAGHRTVFEADAPWVFRSVNQKKASRKKSGWIDVLLGLSASTFGPYKDVCRTPARIFLRQLSHSIELATERKHKAEAERNKRHAKR